MEFPKEYFEKEVRCDFEVPTMMKRAWAAQMEVLKVVGDICEKHGLQYFADWGTLLGAIRHKGFIPWDDDIDICIKRDDYMKLIRILPQELPKGFVVAGMYSPSERLQNAAYVAHLRVIADETLWDFNDYMKYFHGFPYQRAGIDIFPLDNAPADFEELVEVRKLASQGVIILRDWEALKQSGVLDAYLAEYGRICGVEIPKDVTPNWLWRMVDAICSLYAGQETEFVTNWGGWRAKLPHYYKKEWYDKAVYVPFEHMQIPVPCGYEELLQKRYGDYTVFRRGTAAHNYPFYGHMEAELEKQIRAVGFTGTIDEFCEKVSSGELRV